MTIRQLSTLGRKLKQKLKLMMLRKLRLDINKQLKLLSKNLLLETHKKLLPILSILRPRNSKPTCSLSETTPQKFEVSKQNPLALLI